MMEKEIYLIRHGQTDYNKKGIIQGRGVDSDINATGKLQAQAFYDAFGNIRFDQIFISTLKRTAQTVSPFKAQQYDFSQHQGLDEMHWGIHEGKVSSPEMKKAYFDILNNWKKGQLDLRMSGGESPLDLQERQMEFISKNVNDFEGKMLICSHGRALRSLLCCFTQRPLQEMDQFPHANVSLYKLSYIKGLYAIDLFNYTDHLKHIEIG